MRRNHADLQEQSASRAIPPRPVLIPSEGHAIRHRPDRAILYDLEYHIRESGVSASRVGRLIANDPALVSQLRAGRQPGAGVVRKIEAFIAARAGLNAQIGGAA